MNNNLLKYFKSSICLYRRKNVLINYRTQNYNLLLKLLLNITAKLHFYTGTFNAKLVN